MQIVQLNQDTFEIKTKSASLVTGNESRINTIALMGPGEYEIAGIEVFGISQGIYVFIIEDMHVLYAKNISRMLTDTELAAMENIDMAILSIGEGELDAKTASQIVKATEPVVIIPSGSDIAAFCEAMGGCPEPVSVYKITKPQLAVLEGQNIIQLKPVK